MLLTNPSPIPSDDELINFLSKSDHFSTPNTHSSESKQASIREWLENPYKRPNNYFNPVFYSEAYSIKPQHSLYDFLTHGWRVGRRPDRDIDILKFTVLHRISLTQGFGALNLLLDMDIVEQFRRTGSSELSRNSAIKKRSVSCVTVNYNNATGLYQTLKSMRSKAFEDVEKIVIDGGSTDNSHEVIDQFKEGLGSVIVGQDSGIFDAMNIGARIASHDYVIFMNSGDCFYSGKNFSKITDNLGAADIVYGCAKFQGHKTPHPYKTNIALGMCFSHQAQFTRREWLTNFPFKVDVITADWLFNLICYKNGATFSNSEDLVANMEPSGFSIDHVSQGLIERMLYSSKAFGYDYIEKFFQTEILKSRQSS